MTGHLPIEEIPYIEADFNACGWAGGDDRSFYALDKRTLASIGVKDGMLVFVWTDDDPGEILGEMATLEHVTLGGFTGWRAKPIPDTFYRGPKPPGLRGT